jgi:hypothetical protein
MSVLKFSTRAPLVALALLAASAHPASAETLFLKCNMDSAPDVHATLTIDLTKGTVNNQPATINETAIDWQTPLTGAVTATEYDHLDRTTGTMTEKITYHLAKGDRTSDPSTYTCTKTSAPAKKF